MALVLSCPRCLQSRSVSAVIPNQPQYCPFCRLELEVPELPAKANAKPVPARKRKARRWPLFLFAVLLLLIPAGFIVALAVAGKRDLENELANNSIAGQRAEAYQHPNESLKPARVLSAVTEPPKVTVNQRKSSQRPAPVSAPPVEVSELVAMPEEVREVRVATPTPSSPSRKIPTPWPVRVDRLDQEIRNAELERDLKEALGPPIPATASAARLTVSEADLKKLLARVPEIDLDSKDPKDRTNANALRQAAKQQETCNPHPLLQLARTRGDLKSLPFRKESECQLSPKQAELLSKESSEVRLFVSAAIAEQKDKSTAVAGAIVSVAAQAVEKKYKSLVLAYLNQLPPAALNQIVMGAETEVRLQVVYAQARHNQRGTTTALANRAVFDLDEGSRRTAVQALQQREPADYLPVLLQALRHPWPPAAQNSAFALSALKAKSIVPVLASMLNELDPCAPFATKKDEWPMVREVVRINHLRNCMLCHAAQTVNSGEDFRHQVPGLIPPPDEKVEPFSIVYYDPNGKGSFIRADVTYLQQDFSVTLPVKNPGKWPAEQRYDFFVRVRPATVWERLLPPNKNYPQRAAVLMALRELTRMDGSDDAAEWREPLKLPKQ